MLLTPACCSTYVPVDYIPAIFGLSSLVAWLFALFPQLITNHRRKNADDLSVPFVLLWLGGDIASVAGLLMLGKRLTAVMLSLYFCLNDAALLAQIFYFRFRRTRLGAVDGANVSGAKPTSVFAVLLLTSIGAVGLYADSATAAAGSVGSVGRSLLSEAAAAVVEECSATAPRPSWVIVLGCVLSWASGMLYFTSRIPQVIKNYRSKEVEGLSIAMFSLSIFANLAFGMQFIAETAIRVSRGNPMDWAAFVSQDLPFVLGSAGTVIYDVIIVFQSVVYAKAAQKRAAAAELVV